MLDFTNPMFNAQKKQLSSQGRHRGFKHIEVNRKGCQKEKDTHMGFPASSIYWFLSNFNDFYIIFTGF